MYVFITFSNKTCLNYNNYEKRNYCANVQVFAMPLYHVVTDAMINYG